MTRNAIDIQPRPIAVLETYEHLVIAGRRLAHHCGFFVLGTSLRASDGIRTFDARRQVKNVLNSLDVGAAEWTTFTHRPESDASARSPRVQSDTFNPRSTPNTDLVVGRHQLAGWMTATFMAPTRAYLEDRVRADARLSELLAEGKTDPTLVDPEHVYQSSVLEGQMLIYRPLEGKGAPILYAFEPAGPDYAEEVTLFARPAS
ncbi:MAG TPA: hypothetical protein VLI54_01640 [Bacillota bacterium]|nr:hypothetical protein [Bacillota bacterium]